MKTIRNVIAGGMIALAVGFAGGELLGPTATSATSTTCSHEVCYVSVDGRFCAATQMFVDCELNEFLETCNTRECEPE